MEQPSVNIVPDGTSSGSSPVCSNMLETTIWVPHLQYPSCPANRLAPHLRVQKWQLSKMRFAISIFRSRYDFSGSPKSSKDLRLTSISSSKRQKSSVSWL